MRVLWVGIDGGLTARCVPRGCGGGLVWVEQWQAQALAKAFADLDPDDAPGGDVGPVAIPGEDVEPIAKLRDIMR